MKQKMNGLKKLTIENSISELINKQRYKINKTNSLQVSQKDMRSNLVLISTIVTFKWCVCRAKELQVAVPFAPQINFIVIVCKRN